jgi:hypothetical protein
VTLTFSRWLLHMCEPQTLKSTHLVHGAVLNRARRDRRHLGAGVGEEGKLNVLGLPRLQRALDGQDVKQGAGGRLGGVATAQA